MTNRQILQDFLDAKRLEIISKINQASGRTARRIHSVVDQFSGILYGPDYIGALEDGRGPTKTSTPSKPTLREAIEEWLQFTGIPTPAGKTRRDLAYAIAHSIHAKGTRLFQQGGKSGVLSNTITPNAFDKLIEQLTEVHTIQVSTEVVNKFKIELKRNAA